MKRIISGLLALIMVLACASCSGGGSGESIVYPIKVSPETLDPQYSKDTGAQLIVNNIYEGLVRYNAKGEIIPGIAKSWTTSDDGLTWTFTLKEGTEWYCTSGIKAEFGEEFYKKFSSAKVTANDFVFACRRTVDPATDSPSAHRMLVFENASDIIAGEKDVAELGVTAKDDYTLEFRLVEPCENMLDRLTECEFMPCNEEFFNSMGGRYGVTVKHLLCNGPFYVSSWDPENTMTCKANKYYAGEQTVSPASVVFAFENTDEEVLTKLSTASLTAALLSPETELPAHVKVAKEIKDTVYGFMFNCEDEILKSGNIRKALCSSIDISLFDIKGDNIFAQNGLIPQNCMAGSANYREKVEGQTPTIAFDKQNAQKLWTKGLEKLEKTSATITVLCPEELETCVRRQFQLWQELFGISLSVKVEVAPADEIAKAVSKGEYQIAISSIHSSYEDAVSFLADLRDGGVFNYSSNKFRDIIDRLSLVETEEEIISGCFTAEDYLLKQGVCFPLYTKASRFVVSEDAGDIIILDSEKSISFINAKRFD